VDAKRVRVVGMKKNPFIVLVNSFSWKRREGKYYMLLVEFVIVALPYQLNQPFFLSPKMYVVPRSPKVQFNMGGGGS